jgi:hypothetical protein
VPGTSRASPGNTRTGSPPSGRASTPAILTASAATRSASGTTRRVSCAASPWLAGYYDQTYAGPHPSFGATVEDFRIHYADDALRMALHHLVWAEHYAGLRDRDSARSADPFR